MRTIILSLLLVLTCVDTYAEDSIPMDLQVVLPFYRCLDLSTESELEALTRPFPKEISTIQTEVLKKVISECYSFISNEKSQSQVLLHYEGDPLQAKGFLEGLVSFGQIYVSWRVMEFLRKEE